MGNLTSIRVSTIGFVKKAATRRKFLLLKSEGKGDAMGMDEMEWVEINEPVAAALVEPIDGEADVVKALDKAEQAKAVAAIRILSKSSAETQDLVRQTLGDPPDARPLAKSAVELSKAAIAVKEFVDTTVAAAQREHLARTGKMLSKAQAQVEVVRALPRDERDLWAAAERATTPCLMAKAEPALPDTPVYEEIKALAKSAGISEVEVMRRHPVLYEAYTREAHGRGAIFNRS